MTVSAREAVMNLRREAQQAGAQYESERFAVEKTREEKIVPLILAMSEIPLPQGTIAEDLRVTREVVRRVQLNAGLEAPRRPKPADGETADSEDDLPGEEYTYSPGYPDPDPLEHRED